MVFAPIKEWCDVDAERFRAEVAPSNQPAVLRGAVGHWPAVAAARLSAQKLIDYLAGFGLERPVDLLAGGPEFVGKFFYNHDLGGLNFTRAAVPFGDALGRMRAQIAGGERPTLAIQAAEVESLLPGFGTANGLGFALAPAPPHLWIGGALKVQTHADYAENIACVVAGRRRFTLFPPDQVANLYIGPLDFTPASTPVSMVDLDAPDFGRYPRFAKALESAQSAELEAGDALYIPYLWWHQVAALEPFNMLVNYWWNEAVTAAGAPLDAMLFALMNLRLAPERQRAAWRAMFDFFVFQTQGDPAAHLPFGREGVQGPITPERAKYLELQVLRKLVRRT
jgi:Cupin-like domain